MRLGKISYFGDFVACPATILFISAEVAPRHGTAAVAAWLALMAVGVFEWTLVEYLVHRWVYHRYWPFKHYHDMHHAEPEAQIGAPSFISIALILGFLGAPLLPFGLFVAGAVSCGLLLGYTAYVLVHHAVHHWRPKVGSLFYGLRRLHARHHYARTPINFGVTTSLWDHVFGTLLEEPRRAVRRTAPHT
jgi:sterol desaturase/sphingolipid hydroxylase (fatty acid hydroxylase superfamily)